MASYIPVNHYPDHLENEFVRLYFKWIDQIDEKYAKILLDNYENEINRGLGLDAKNLYDTLRDMESQAARIPIDSVGIEVSKMGTQLNTWNYDKVKSDVARLTEGRRFPTVDIRRASPLVNTQLAQWTNRNAALIKQVTLEHTQDITNYLLVQVQKDVSRIVSNSLTKGEALRTIQSRIKEVTKVTDNKARLWARDQMAKGHRSVNKARLIDSGLNKGYIWITSRDGRVRDTHADKHGLFFRWDEDIEPGEDVQCRCYASPAIDNRDELTQTQIKKDLQFINQDKKFNKQNKKLKRQRRQQKKNVKNKKLGRKTKKKVVKKQNQRIIKTSTKTIRAQQSKERAAGKKKTTPDRFVFKEATTKSEAEKFLKDIGFAQTVNYNRLSLKNANKVNKAATKFVNRYKLLNPLHVRINSKNRAIMSASGKTLNISNKFITDAAEKRTFEGSVTNYKKNIRTQVERLNGFIKKHEAEGKDVLANITRSQKDVLLEKGKYLRHNVFTGPKRLTEDVLFHEMGHTISDQTIGMINGAKIRNSTIGVSNLLIDKWNSLFAKYKDNPFRYKVSYYAQSNAREFFAETFAMYNFERSRLPGELIKSIEEVIKEL